jgi:non-specific serine/threonine protein kinase
LARSTGLGGRDRLAASAAERARISVTKALKASIRRIEGESPTLGKHLKASVRTGVYCCYAPEDSTVRWEL